MIKVNPGWWLKLFQSVLVCPILTDCNELFIIEVFHVCVMIFNVLNIFLKLFIAGVLEAFFQ
jgi:hypothetical protein